MVRHHSSCSCSGLSMCIDSLKCTVDSVMGVIPATVARSTMSNTPVRAVLGIGSGGAKKCTLTLPYA
eukprot:2484770-Pyramimonas_sp.AAC.1